MNTVRSGRTRARITMVLLAIAAMVGLSGLVASPAQAAYGNCVGDSTGARVCIDPDGELLRVCDTAADGHHASAAYRGNHDGAYYEAGAYGGDGTCKVFNFDMAENDNICYVAMVVEGNDIQYWYTVDSGVVSAGDGRVLPGWCPYFDPDTVIMD